MAKQQYKGSLTLEWYNKNKAIILRDETSPTGKDDVPAPKINWINKDQALFYEIVESEGRGLEPFWVDRNDIRVKETRPLVFQKGYRAKPKDTDLTGQPTGYNLAEVDQDDPTINNFLIRGDNLLALNTLKKIFEQKDEQDKVKCIYIDPPYNTGASFKNYDDNLENSEWLTMMRDRLITLHSILRIDGFLCCQIDDSQSHYLKILLDEIFGRHNYLTSFYFQVRYGDKTLSEDNDYQKVVEQCFVYAKDGKTAKANKDSEPYKVEKFKWEIIELEKGEEFEAKGRKVEVFKEGQYEIKEVEPSLKGLKETWATGSLVRQSGSSGEFLDTYLIPRREIDGLSCLYKVYGIGEDGLGYRYMTGPKKPTANKGKFYSGIPLQTVDAINSGNANKFKPIQNFYDFAGNFGNCRLEGGVDIGGGKKPEILLETIFKHFSDPGDLILDCFSGSGTTVAVAQKMGRSWIGVEVGKHADTLIIKRLESVLDGTDQSGISSSTKWQGGGSFKYYHLGPSIIEIGENGKGDFNWQLGRTFIEESLLNSYDYIRDDEIRLPSTGLFEGDDKPKIGRLQIGTKVMSAVCSLNEPDGKREMMEFEEILALYTTIKKEHSPEFITIFTNRGVEMALESKPEDLEIIKVPHAIFAELEK